MSVMLPIALFVVSIAGCSPRLHAVSPSPLAPLDHEPAPAAAFVDAFSRGNETAAEQVASPLYQAEWRRIGVTPEQRFSWRRLAGLSPSGRWISLRYIGGVTGASGRHHLLYTAISNPSTGRTTDSVWRFDTDPAGKVIWGEMVYLFSDSGGQVTRINSTVGLGGASAAPTLASYHPLVLVGVEAETSHEGYFAMVQEDPRPSGGNVSAVTSVRFLAIDSDGIVRPGVWSYQS